ncbi:cellulose synthase/poly-beta-1,6-N-acetylglucosamine synthase-like glycosyltransferase [Neolewinella xylanilytica]|uniref:Cellulose synthase/poly-beta-1,6-N-acetylglucosamine synthase-like glycosyltransferase n=1 Tax=Neolewinella xylanilytica TaxID=1514080 RepID=A0A2S6I188_9BACT|nr:cellulose synthase family protein [Neolewinella xylanilytica]PPK84643.1 cellulose synthase/poly-beta-1,6-N-acetylglucosamine synthase-like glycosyltransferase [Neolewinella xylanilytica]
MTILAFLVLAIYSISLLYITVYCLLQFNLLYHYRYGESPWTPAATVTRSESLWTTPGCRSASTRVASAPPDRYPDDVAVAPAPAAPPLPFVTVQLPIYNEYYVIGRLIDAVAAFDYPKDRYEIHVLDDSDDETVDLVAKKVAEYRARGYRIRQIIRPNREGFKAGALRDGMREAKGEFIAIFDADFVPPPTFLCRTVPHFADPRIGVVQTRWEHLNENYSLITRLQALQLNVHFTVEQVGRMKGGHLLQFNGTAGIWRREAIDAGGGWQPDTLTEDLDLSIRSQLAGYRIRYLEGEGSPAELPVDMNGFKSQQHRWMKGGAETARKMLPDIWRSGLALGTKIHATVHLLASSIFLFVFVCGVISVPLLFLLGELEKFGFSKHFFALFLTGLLSVVTVYFVANVRSVANREKRFGKSLIKFFILFPLFLALSMGLSLHNSIAVLQGYRGQKSPFVRTPKFNISSVRDKFRSKKYFSGRLNGITLGEGVLSLYFLLAVAGAFYVGNTTFVVFHALLAIGYGAIFFYSVKHLGLTK